jgi:tetratricopeptide (TPR) repeat protein
MDEGDAAMQSGKLAVAKQKYNFALVIKGNGPGNPSDKLRQIASQLATAPESPISQKQDTSAVKIAPVAKQQNEKNKGKVAAKSASDIPKKITDFLVKAHDDEKKKNTSAAISDYEEVIALDPQQQEALAEKQRLTEAVQKDRNALEDTLIRGVRSYSQSHFEEARESLSHYLDEGGVRKGAAYFYLGAAFMAKALLLDAQNKTGYDNMQRNALRNFHLAKQEHFKPLEKYVSPKILAVWNQADS